MKVFHLYRPRLPEMRAQSIQVLHTCHALARRRHEVTLLADREVRFPGGMEEALAPYGLSPVAGLNLELAPTAHPGSAGVWFRTRMLHWVSTRRGFVYARDKERLDSLLPFRRVWPFRVVMEFHEVESAQARERGDASGAERWERMERRLLQACQGVVTNCEGTLEVLLETYGDAVPARRRVIHNGTDPSRAATPMAHEGQEAGYFGSLRAYKEIGVLLEAADSLPENVRLRLVGGAPGTSDWDLVVGRAGSRVTVQPEVPYTQVASALASVDVVVVSLGNDLYGRRLASPLKLWDYLATGLPIVAPDLPSIRVICGDEFHSYEAGSSASLAMAIRRAFLAGARRPRVRTWADRAAEIEAFLAEIA